MSDESNEILEHRIREGMTVMAMSSVDDSALSLAVRRRT